MTRWLILRTSGGQTVPLARSLIAAGYPVWTPTRTIRRVSRPGTPHEQKVEIDVPILPTFVFARERDMEALVGEARERTGPHPAFSVFCHAGKVPMIREASIAGLREEEAREAAILAAIRSAETHAEAERIRVAAIKSASARRRAEAAAERQRLAELRAQQCEVEVGEEVGVADMPALVGVTGILEAVDGSYASVRFGTQSWKIDGWRVIPVSLHDNTALRSLAA